MNIFHFPPITLSVRRMGQVSISGWVCMNRIYSGTVWISFTVKTSWYDFSYYIHFFCLLDDFQNRIKLIYSTKEYFVLRFLSTRAKEGVYLMEFTNALSLRQSTGPSPGTDQRRTARRPAERGHGLPHLHEGGLNAST